MYLPKIHYDWQNKHEPTLLEIVSRLLASTPKEALLDGAVPDSLNRFGEQVSTTGMIVGYALYMFRLCGQHVYAMGPHVADAFSRTDLSGITADQISTPFPSFYVALKDVHWRLWGGTHTQWHTLTGAYVQHTKRYNPETEKATYGLHIVLWGAPNKRSRGPLDDIVFWYSIDLGSCPEGIDLEEYFQTQEVMSPDNNLIDRCEQTLFVDEFVVDGAPVDVTEVQRQAVAGVFRLIINMLLYLKSEQPDLLVHDRKDERKKVEDAIGRAKSNGKVKKLKRKLDHLPGTVITYVGQGIEQKLKDASRRTSSATSRSAPRAHLVRPHWRHYWVGPKAQQRRVRRWIHLFERGSGEPARTIHKFRKPPDRV